MIFSDGSYIPTFIIFSAIGIIIKCAPVEYPLFHKSFPFHSYYGFRFSLPVDINEKLASYQKYWKYDIFCFCSS